MLALVSGESSPGSISDQRSLASYGRLLVARNVAASNQDLIDEQVAAFRALDGYVVAEIETSPDKEETKLLIEKATDDRTIVIAATGDGGMEGILLAALGSDILLWKGKAGNGDNFGRTSFPRWHRSNPASILQHGRIASAHALACEITSNDGKGETETHIFPDIVGFGKNARAALAIDDPEHRKQRNKKGALGQLRADAKVIGKAIDEVPSFKIERDGKVVEYHDLMFSNLRTIARVGKTAVKLSDPRFVEIENYYLLPKLGARLSAIRMMVFALRGRSIRDGEQIKFTVGEDVDWQGSGNHAVLNPGDTVSIYRTEEAFHYVTTRRRP